MFRKAQSKAAEVPCARDLCRSGGTGKAETAKLPGAGIGPKQCPEKCMAKKGYLPKSVGIGVRSRREAGQRGVAVGTPVAQRPPRGSVLALISAHGSYRRYL